MASDNEEEKKAPGKAGRPEMTPEQEAEIAAKKAARAEAKAQGGKAGKAAKGKGQAAAKEVAQERVKRDKPARPGLPFHAGTPAGTRTSATVSSVVRSPRYSL